MSSEAEQPLKVGIYRWLVVALLFVAIVINYVDRLMFGFLKPDYLQPAFHWTESDYAFLVTLFTGAYALCYALWGALVDRVGAKWGFGLAFALWTLAHIGHGLVRSLIEFKLVRLLLGIGEAGGFPSGIKAVTEWFPKSERALATGIFNAGSNIGAIVTPLLIPFIVVTLGLGWRASFVIVGLASLLWLPLWIFLYTRPRESKRLSPAELAFIESDPPDAVTKVSWWRVLRTRETWAYALARFLIDPVWYMFIFWLPDFLKRTYGMDIKTFGPPLVVIYLMSDLGSIGGGFLSSTLIKRGRSINAARKTALFCCALLAVPILFAAQVSNLWLAVLIIGLATAAHQGFSSNLYTLPGDVFPRAAVASVIGIGGAVGGIGGMLFSTYIGQVLDYVGSYAPIFAIAAFAYLAALIVVHLITPKYAPAKLT